jgi:hypothetical protein
VRWYWPSEVDIVCPRCSSAATLDLEVFLYEPWEGLPPDVSGEPHLHLWNNVVVTERYPAVVPWVAPKAPAYPPRGTGAARCPSCGLIAKHDLDWPADALWRWDVRGSTLWAWSRGHAKAIREYVAQTHRDAAAFGEWQWALEHLPTEFLRASVREDVLRKIDRDLHRV